MRAVTTTATIREDHSLTVQLPSDIPPGPQTVVVVLEEPTSIPRPQSLHLSPHKTGPTDLGCTYRREDMYGDDGR